MSERASATIVTPIQAAGSRKRGARHSRPVIVEFLPAVSFELPIFYRWERPSQPAPDMVLADDGGNADGDLSRGDLLFDMF